MVKAFVLKYNSIINNSESAINCNNIIYLDMFRELAGIKGKRVFKHFKNLMIDDSVAPIL